MSVITYFHKFTTAPSQLSFIQKCSAALACLIAIFLTATITQHYAPNNTIILIASMGASAVLLFAVPSSTMAKPWPFVGGQMLSALVGIYVAHYEVDFINAATLAVGISVLLMLFLRCLHPPGAATALASLHNTVNAELPDFSFLLIPVGINVFIMLIISILINRLISTPTLLKKTHFSTALTIPDIYQNHLSGVDRSDMEQVIQNTHKFMDIGTDDLYLLLTQLHLLSFQKNSDLKICSDIMQYYYCRICH